MPQGALTPIQGALATVLSQAQTALMDAQAAGQLVNNKTISDLQTLITSIQSAQSLVAGGGTLDTSITQDATAVQNLSAQLTDCQSKLSAASATSPGTTLTPIATPSNPTGVPASSIVTNPSSTTSPTGQTQTYVSAPAVGALMAVTGILGAAAGYAGKAYLEGKKSAREAQMPRRGRRRVQETNDVSK